MTPGVRPLIVANWKMHMLAAQGAALARAVAVDAPPGVDLVLCPPATILAAVAAALAGTDVTAGGQDCHAAAGGAHTGDIAAPMLRDAGARWAILGHSERRAAYQETDAAVAAKAAAAIAAGLTPIVCVGEQASERDGGRAEAVVTAQLAGSLPDGFAARGGVVAYEPVCAIGTGRTPTPAEIGAMHAAIRAALVQRFGAAGAGCRLLYGGSVKPGNAAEILAVADVNGALVGGASLVAADFLAIAAAVTR